MFASLREDRISIGQLTYNVARTATAGPPLAMFHGVTRRWQTFLPLLPSLAASWRIMALDFRGHGRSDRDVGRYRVIDYIRDGVNFLHSQPDEPLVVYGHSLGAMVAAAVAAEAPQRVRAVILEDPPFETMGTRIAQTRLHSYFRGMHGLAGSARPLAELVHDVGQLQLVDPASGDSQRLGELRDEAGLRFTAKCLAQLDPDVLEPIIAGRWLEGYRRADILRRVCCPVLLVQADMAAGGMLTDEDAAELQMLLPHCRAVKMPGAGHLIHDVRPKQLVDLVENFLSSLEIEVDAPSHLTSQETTDEDG